MSRGKFIALEGGEGTGKSTQCRLLAKALGQRGITSDTTREPGGTPGAEAVRTLLLHPPGKGWGAEAEALLFAAARSDHVATKILPTLDAGHWVICDRFVDSSRAYQGGAGGLGDDTIAALHQIGSAGLRPDCTILIDVPAEVTAARLAERDVGNSDAIGGRGTEYHAAVRQTFLELAQRDPAGFVVIDGDAEPDVVHNRIMTALAPLLSAE